MSWWETSQGDEIGDQPANLVEVRLGALAEARRHAAAPLPTPPQFMATLAAALEAAAARSDIALETVEAGGAEVRHLAAIEDLEFFGVLRDLVADIGQCYRSYLERPARLREVCAVFAFVLRAAPERFLDNAAGWGLQRIRIPDPEVADSPLPPLDDAGTAGETAE